MDENVVLQVFKAVDLVVGRSYHRNLKIENMGNRTYNSIRIFLLKDSYHERSFIEVGRLAPGATRSLRMRCDVLGGVTSSDIPSQFTFQAVDNNGTVLCSKSCAYSMDEFNGTFQQSKYVPKSSSDGRIPPRYNIFVFGLAGSGKSSLVNAWITMLHNGQNVQNPLERGGSEHHVTKTLHYYHADEMVSSAEGRRPVRDHQQEKFRFAICDAWGLTNDNYDQFTLDSMVEGHLPSNWNMGDTYAQHFDLLNSADAVNTRYKRRMHAVVFVIPCQTVQNNNFLNQCRRYFAQLQGLCGNAIIVLARADSIDTNVRHNPNQDANVSAALKGIKDKVATHFNIEPSRIFYGVNYTTENKRSFNIDKNNFRILERALDQASSFSVTKSTEFIF